MSKYLNLEKNPKYINLKEPAQIIQEGGIVIFPTETVYGIGVNGLNETAIKKLYEVKQRPINKPISLLVNSIEMIEKVAKDITCNAAGRRSGKQIVCPDTERCKTGSTFRC